MVRLIAVFAVFAATILSPAPANADFKSGNDLYQDCTTREDAAAYYQKRAYCMGYIVGVADANSTFGAIIRRPLFCLSAGVTTGQLVDVVTRYLETHPQSRHYAAASLVGGAFMEAFPCPPARP